MKWTALEIQQKEFTTGFRGYTQEEVRTFLREVSDAVEGVVRENIGLKEEIARQEAEIGRHRAKEKLLEETLVSAQKAAGDLQEHARREAELILAQAQLDARKLLERAHARRVEVLSEISGLESQRVQFEAQIRQIVESHLELLDALSVGAPASLRSRVPESQAELFDVRAPAEEPRPPGDGPRAPAEEARHPSEELQPQEGSRPTPPHGPDTAGSRAEKAS